MLKTTIFTLFLCFAIWTIGQSQVSTFIIVRHAEKMADGSKDPDLSPEGKKRAEALSKMLNKLEINQIYTTEYKRTQQTAQPMAQAKGLKTQTYPAKPEDAFIQKLLQENQGKTTLIVGHSNTVNVLVNLLTKTQKYTALTDEEYQHIFIVNVFKNGETQVLQWQYPF